MTAVDFSFARYTAAELKAKGVTTVFRYLRGQGKAVTAAELATLFGGDIRVVLVDEMTAADATGGEAAGVTHAKAQNAALAALGLPAWTVVYVAADKEYPVPATAIPFFQGVASVRSPATIGAYGEGALLQALRQAGLVAYTWQSMSSSFPGNGTRLETSNVVQVTTAAPEPTCDLDVVQTFIGQVVAPAPTPAPTPVPTTYTEVPMPIIREGDSGTAVEMIQAACNKAFGAGLKVDGDFGGLTLSAVVAAQTKWGITHTGAVGPQTWPHVTATLIS